MKNSTGSPTLDRLLRTVVQFVLAGGITLILDAAGIDASPLLLGIVQIIVTACQNYAEEVGLIPAVLKGSSEAEYAQQLGLRKGMKA